MGYSATEYKDKIGGDALGVSRAAKMSRLGSPNDGVPILGDSDNSEQLIKEMENLLGLRSWIDNV